MSETCGSELGVPIAKFAANMLRQMRGKADTSNFVFSPFSIHMLMSTLLAGAGTDTLTQMKQTLYLSDFSLQEVHAAYKKQGVSFSLAEANASNTGVTLNVGNRIYVHQDFAERITDFAGTILDAFGSAAETVVEFNENTRSTINLWVEKETRQKIKDLLAPGSLTSLTRLVLVNAIYFKGAWKEKFDASKTIQDAPFTLSDASTVPVQMMTKKANYRLVELKELQAHALEMPYQETRFSMILLLSDRAELHDSMVTAVNDPDRFNFASIPFEQHRPKKVFVKMPRFKIETAIDLSQTLQEMGMSDLFSDGKADLSGIAGTKSLYVSQVVHKAVIEVNEEGAEAAAATAAVVTMRSMPMIDEFIMDRQFMYAIRDSETNAILFTGSVNNPTSASSVS